MTSFVNLGRLRERRPSRLPGGRAVVPDATPGARRRRRVILILLGCVAAVVTSGPAASPARADIEGVVAEVGDKTARITLAEPGAGERPTIAVGDTVYFSTTVDGFDLDAGTGRISDLGDGFVRAVEVDPRVRTGMSARIAATGPPRSRRTEDPAGEHADDPLLARVIRGYTDSRSDRWEAIKTVYMLKESTRGSSEWRSAIHWKRPDLVQIDAVDFSGRMFGGHGRLVTLVGGGRGRYFTVPIGGSEPVAGALPANILRTHEVHGPVFDNIFSFWSRKGYELHAVGETSLDGRQAVQIEVRAPGLSEASFFFDARTHRIIGHRIRAAGDEARHTILRDFRQVDGVTVPFFSETRSPTANSHTRMIRFMATTSVIDGFFEDP